MASTSTHDMKPLRIHESSFDASGVQGIAVSEVRILRGSAGPRLITTSKGIWSALILWDLQDSVPREVARWTSQGSIFRGFVVNDTPGTEALVAISVSRDELVAVTNSSSSIADTNLSTCKTMVLSIDSQDVLCETLSVTTLDNPTALTGGILALSDATLQTTLMNHSTAEIIATLRSLDDLPGANLHPGLLVSFTRSYSLVRMLLMAQTE
jgi:hypothetical protein